MGIEYTAVPQSEGSGVAAAYALDADDEATNTLTGSRRISKYEFAKRALILFNLLIFGLIMGFCVGRKHPMNGAMGGGGGSSEGSKMGGLLPPSAFVPESEYSPALWRLWGVAGLYFVDGQGTH